MGQITGQPIFTSDKKSKKKKNRFGSDIFQVESENSDPYRHVYKRTKDSFWILHNIVKNWMEAGEDPLIFSLI